MQGVEAIKAAADGDVSNKEMPVKAAAEPVTGNAKAKEAKAKAHGKAKSAAKRLDADAASDAAEPPAKRQRQSQLSVAARKLTASPKQCRVVEVAAEPKLDSFSAAMILQQRTARSQGRACL